MAIETTSDLSSVVSSQIVDGAVTSAKIAAGAVGSAALASSSVVAASIAAGAVGSAALADNAVVSSKIATGSVNSAIIADNAVVAAKIADAAVGAVKISSGTATSGTLLTANGSGGVSFAAAPAGGGMVLISSVSVTAAGGSISFINIPETYTKLHLIGQFYVTASGENSISVSPSTSSSGSGASGYTSSIEYVNKTTDNSVTTYGTGNNNFEGTSGSAFVMTIPNQQNRFSLFNLEIDNYRCLGPVSRVGFLSQQHAGRFVGHGWGIAAPSTAAPVRSISVSASATSGLFRLYGS